MERQFRDNYNFRTSINNMAKNGLTNEERAAIKKELLQEDIADLEADKIEVETELNELVAIAQKAQDDFLKANERAQKLLPRLEEINKQIERKKARLL